MKQVFTLLLIIITLSLWAQKETNIWYFGYHAGLDFNSGEPQVISNNNVYKAMGTAVICDSAGNLLFYCDGRKVYNRLHNVMSNGDNLFDDDYAVTQRVLIVKLPGSQNLYYIFCVGRGDYGLNDEYGLWYSIVDMNQDNGMGEVIQPKILLSAAYDAQEKLTAVKHKDGESIWILTRKTLEERFAAFLLSANGLNTNPVISNFALPPYNDPDNFRGYMKVSYDKKYLFAASQDTYPRNATEVCRFNDETGEINYLYYILKEDELLERLTPFGIEFSPDSRYAYIAFSRSTVSPISGVDIYQYDMSKIEDPIAFAQSAILINPDYQDRGPGVGLQLATDGKIYCSFPQDAPPEYYKVSVIHKPWKRGLECSYQRDVIDLGANEVWWCFPNILLDHLYRFEWEGNCAGMENGVKFKPNFNPIPDSIRWVFSDPDAGNDSVSTELSPTHYFTHAGDFEVIVDVWYPPTPNNPMGRYEHTSRVITIDPAASPDLGDDLKMCESSSISLNAGSEQGSYSWSTGAFGQNMNSITVYDTGMYWVRVRNSFGCYGSDTINVSLYPPPSLDTTNLVLSPTTCGGSTGAIRGLTVSGAQPIALEWKNNAGTVLSNEEDIFNLPVGNYYLWATDGNGCNNLVSQYTISDAGDVLIASVSHSDSYCGQNNGSITITAVSGLSDMLEYSIDNGNTWQNNEGLFEGLAPGPHNVWVKVPDESGCQAVYASNPVMIDDFSGPQVTASSEPATGSNANGSITLTAAGFGNLTYSLNGGTPQSSGEFTGLIAGTYTWRVEDENGCFTEGSIEVGQEAGFIISAIAGNSAVCLGNAPVAPLLIENFTGVQAFTATLEYDATLVNCEGFRPGSVHPQLEANLIAEVYPASQRIVVTWSGSAPLTLTETVTVLDLVFSATQAGNSFLTWDQAPAATWFTGEYGSIEPEFQIGQIQVNNPPVLAQQFPVNVCEGELAWLTAPGSGNEPLTYQWTLPDGSTSQNSSLMFYDASTTHSGQYQVKVSDPLGCSDSTLLTLQVTPNPADWFLQDTILFENQYLLAGPAGYASYLWSTGNTLPEITVNSEGLYTLQLTTHNLCAGADSTYLKMLEAESPFLVPNAFTPNNDGLNDTFRPVVDYERVRMFSMVIYNRWGQLIFETTNPAEGWNGKDSPAGVYSWVISYSDRMGKVVKMRGGVTVVK
ncbi:MAG: PKD domain-containing [Bacteroidetes bacterium]|nr:MAG: PKD domain-containing [Bacteroidota bacterium]